MTRRAWRLMAAMAVLGLAIRLVLAFAFVGDEFDQTSFDLVRDALASHPLDTYALVADRWPYPPAYFPWIRIAGSLDFHTGLAFHGLVTVPAMLADLVIAYMVQWFLGFRGATERARLAGFALVALGPSFMVISGYHGQIDSVAFAWAVAALLVWERDGPNRALHAGLLLGVGGAFKTMPLVMVLALLPSIRSPREAVTLCVAAGGVVALTLVPFALRDAGALEPLTKYAGVGGAGGLSLAVQPELANYLARRPISGFNGATTALTDYGRWLNLAWVLICGAALYLKKVRGPEAAVLLWLTAYVFSTAFFFQYLVWGLPFMVMAGRLRLAAAVQAAVLVPTLLFYLSPWDSSAVVVPYAVMMIGVWVGFAVALFVCARDAVRAPTPATS